MSTWKTDDMALAAYIHMELEVKPGLEWDMGSCYFVFEDTEDVRVCVEDFVSGEGMVEPRLYNMTFAKLKKAIFEHPDAPRTSGRRRRAATT